MRMGRCPSTYTFQTRSISSSVQSRSARDGMPSSTAMLSPSKCSKSPSCSPGDYLLRSEKADNVHRLWTITEGRDNYPGRLDTWARTARREFHCPLLETPPVLMLAP